MIKTFVWVGDPHVQPNNLEECGRLVSLIVDTAKAHKASTLIIPGDLFHTHAVVRLEVLNFWIEATKRFAKEFDKVYYVTGNHDMPGDRALEGVVSALDALGLVAANVRIIRKGGEIAGNFGFLPYYSDNEEFVRAAHKLHSEGADTLVCHQTFQGSKFESGMYAPDGVELGKMPQFKKIISGHIHSQQEFANVFYPGTPKWDSASDANEKKGIWVFKGDERIFVSSEGVCVPIIKYEIYEGFEPPAFPPNSRIYVTLIGSSAWILSQVKKLKGTCRITSKPTDSVTQAKERKAKVLDVFSYVEQAKLSPDVRRDHIRMYLEELCR